MSGECDVCGEWGCVEWRHCLFHDAVVEDEAGLLADLAEAAACVRGLIAFAAQVVDDAPGTQMLTRAERGRLDALPAWLRREIEK